MLVSDLIKEKGAGVITTRPATTVAQAADIIANKRIGAVVVTGAAPGPDQDAVDVARFRLVFRGIA